MKKKTLIYGYGNPGRQDDALGKLFVEKIEDWLYKQNKYLNISTDTNYQLNIEDAYGLNQYERVIFVDASIEDIDNYKFDRLEPSYKANFTMHSVSPGFVVGLCKEMYNSNPDAYLLHIKGYEYGFMKNPTDTALQNLDSSFKFVIDQLERGII